MCFLIISVYFPGVLTVYHLVKTVAACLTKNLADRNVITTELFHQMIRMLPLSRTRSAKHKDHVIGCGKSTSKIGSSAIESGDGASGEHNECRNTLQ